MQTLPTRTQSNTNPSGTGGSAPSTPPTNWSVVEVGANTWTYVGSGVEDGLPYVDIRFQGTAAAGNNSITFDSTTAIVATSAQAWAASLFCYLVGGSAANISSFDYRLREGTAAGSQTALTTQAFTPTSATRLALARRLVSVASTNASTERVANRFTFTEAASGAYDFTLRFAVPQIELGAFASPPMLTGSTTVTGNVQINSGLNLAGGINGFIQFVNLSGGGTSQRVISFDDGTSGNRCQLVWSDTSASILMTSGGVLSGQVTIPGVNPDAVIGVRQTIAFACSTDFIAGRAVGQAAPTVDTSAAYPVVDRLQYGGVGGGVSISEMFRFEKVALKVGPANQGGFDAAFEKAQLAHAA